MYKELLSKVKELAIIAIPMFILIGLFIPNTYHIERSIVIHAPVQRVFAEICDLKKLEAWGPLKNLDPYMQITYESSSSGEEMELVWKSENRRIGSGRQKIIEIIPNERIVINDSIQGWIPSIMCWDLKPIDGGKCTKITWSNQSKLHFINIYRKHGCFSANGRLGMIYEKSLQRLKEQIEYDIDPLD